MKYKMIAIVLVLSSAALTLWGDDIAASGRPIVEKNENAVVTVRLVVKTTYSIPGYGSEQEEVVVEHTGTVIDPSGLTVVSLTATDPSAIFQDMMEGMGDEAEGFQYRTELTDVKILLMDGTEIPARFVLRDKDLDLGFLRPISPVSQPMAALDLALSSTPQRLDPVLVLYRMGKVAGRACATVLHRIQAVSKRPRELYYLSDEVSGYSYSGLSPVLGGPAFTLDGAVAGIVLLRNLKASASGGEMESALILLPSAQVAEIAKQAPSVEQAKEEDTSPGPTASSESSSSAGGEIVLGPDGKAQKP